MLDISALRSVSAGCAALVLFAGCLTPPCNCAQASAPAAAAPATEASPAEGASASAAPAGAQVLWDGDEVGTTAKGWADCDTKPDCKSVLEPTPGAGRNNSMGLKFTGQGKGWIGGGWNLFGWWPKDAGMDVSGSTHLVAWVKVEAKKAEEAPEAGALGIALRCSSSENCASETGMLAKYTKENVLDGQWHEVALPLKDMNKAGFDAKKVWEVYITTWSGTPKSFTVYFDDISLQKR